MYSALFVMSITCLTLQSASSSACQKPTRKFINIVAACDPKPLIYDKEGCKECMYLDTKGIKTIAVGFNLRRSDAASILKSVGANYNAIVNGPATPVNTTCNCKKVSCLTKDQINTILDMTVKKAIADARSVVATFESLCCKVQNAVVDMSFTLGRTRFATFNNFTYWLKEQNWKASADDLRTTKWCQVQATRRCTADADAVQEGCGCSGSLTRSCDAVSSACCTQQETCCKGTLTFKNYITRTVEELLCCPYSNAVCCEQNKCCSSAYPICCLPNFCCAAGNRCISGQCYRLDGGPGKGVPATCRREPSPEDMKN